MIDDVDEKYYKSVRFGEVFGGISDFIPLVIGFGLMLLDAFGVL
jgi:hypothetical protein